MMCSSELAPAPALGRGLMGTACSVAVGFLAAQKQAKQQQSTSCIPKKAGPCI